MSFDYLEKFSPEQDVGARFLADRSCAMLADRVGFGKTAQVIRAAEYVNARKVLFICPPILRLNEIAEAEKWALVGWPAVPIMSGKDPLPARGIVTVSYALAAQPAMRDALRKWKPDVLVLDEAHRIKGGGVWTKAILGARGASSGAARLWFVTGTPAPNDASEWYVYAKSFGAWTGTKRQFVEKFCATVPGPFGLKIVGNRNCEELSELLRPHVISRQRIEDGRPPLTIDSIAVPGELPRFDCTPEDFERIQLALETGNLDLLDSPAVSTVRRLVGLAKAGPVADLIREELESSRDAGPAIVFCQHVATIDTLRKELSKFAPLLIDGRTKPEDRDPIKDAFQTGSHPLILLNAKAAGEGLTLTAARRVFLCEPSWNPEDNTQMIARAWRRGQSSPVRASFVYFPGTIDDAITGTLLRKTRENAKISLTVSA